MKYSYTIISKVFAFCALLILSSNFAYAQKNTDSPYSRFGIGLKANSSYNGNFGMGGVGYAWRPYQYRPVVYDSLARSSAQLNDRGTNYINPKNPASFSNFSLTTFEAGIFSQNTEYISGNQRKTGNNAQLSHMSLAFPVGDKWGMAFGINPFSAVGYDYIINNSVNQNSITDFYQGSGGVNQIFFGTGVELSKNLALGIKGNYLFGSFSHTQRRVFDEQSQFFFNSLEEKETLVSDFTFDLGFQYFKDLKNENRIILGANVSPFDQFDATETRVIRNYTGSAGRESFKDTSLLVEKTSAVSFHPIYGVGFAYEKKKEWMLSIDYTYQPLEEASEFDVASISTNHKVNLGFERYSKPTAFGSFFKQMGYRAGFHYNSSLVRVNGEDIQELGISFGLSLPLRKSFSTLNLGLQAGTRGKDEMGLNQENFFNIQFGVTINDKWFIQRKYD